MLLNVCNSSPDLAFAAHQYACLHIFQREPIAKQQYKSEHIFKARKIKVLTLKSTKALSLECHADADFAGLYVIEDN